MPTRGDLSTNTQPTAVDFGTGGDWFTQNSPTNAFGLPQGYLPSSNGPVSVSSWNDTPGWTPPPPPPDASQYATYEDYLAAHPNAGSSPLLGGNTPPAGRGQMQDYFPSPSGGTASGSGSLGTFAGLNGGDPTSLISQYYQSAGLPADTNYWLQQWNSWGKNDPNYFQTRLINGLATQGGNTQAFGAPNPNAPGGWGPGTAGYSAEGATGAPGGSPSSNLSPSDVMAQDPGYQFQLGQGLDAVQRSAAARGTLLTGGTLKDLNAYAQGLAGTSFGNVFNRNLQLAQLGENAAALQGNAGQNYAAQTGNLFTNQGNANAAATVGGANAFNSAIGPITNSATDIYNYYHNPNNTSSYQSSLPYQNYFGTPYGQGPIPG